MGSQCNGLNNEENFDVKTLEHKSKQTSFNNFIIHECVNWTSKEYRILKFQLILFIIKATQNIPNI
jgi:hypothetical protein